MRFTLGFITGAASAYWYANNASDEQRRQIGRAVERVRDDRRVQKVTSAVTRNTSEVVDAAAEKAADTIDLAGEKVTDKVAPEAASTPAEPEPHPATS